MSHNIVQAIGDDLVNKVYMTISHSTVVTDEALIVISNLSMPPTGLTDLTLTFEVLDMKVSQTVLDQFTQHCRNL